MPVSSSVLTDCEATTAIDNFNYTENPISNGGVWTTPVISGDTSLTTDGTSAGNVGGATGTYSGFRNDATYGPNWVAMVTVTGTIDTTHDETLYIYGLEGAGLGSGTPDGYIVEWRLRASSNDEFRIKRLDAGVETTLSSGTFQEATTGDKFSFVRNGSDIEAWWKTGSTWTFMATVSSATYTADKKIGILVQINSLGDLAPRLDDLKVMNIVAAASALGAPSPPVIRVRLRAY